MQKLFIDLFPLAAFLLLLVVKDIYWATGALMIGSVLQTIMHYLLKKTWDKMHVFGLAFILPLGGLTLFMHDPAFIKWKVTIFFWVVAAIMTFRHFVNKKNTVRDLMEFSVKQEWPAPEALWSRVNLLWIMVALLTGALNIVVAFVLFPDNDYAWGLFKFPGTFIIQMGIMVYTFISLQKYLPEQTPPKNENKE